MRLKSPFGLRRLFVKMYYNEDRVTITKASAANNYSFSYYNANDIFDPNPLIGGHQAFGWQQWLPHFKYFKVHASKINVSVQNGGQADSGGLYLCVYFNRTGQADLQTWFTSVDAESAVPIKENPIIKVRRCGIYNAAKPESSYVKKIKYFKKTKDVYGLKDLDDQDFQGQINSASPANVWQWTVGLRTADNISAYSAIVRVFITYWVELYGPQVNFDLGSVGDTSLTAVAPP